MTNLLNNMLGFNADLKKSFDVLVESHKQFQESFRKLAKQLPPSLKELARHGWYISGDSPIGESVNLASDLQKGHSKKVDNYLAKYYDDNARRIINQLKSQFPDRTKILKEALNAHRQKMYFSSTSLFLIIADGLCKGNLYKTKNRKAHLRKYLGPAQLMGFLDAITEENAIDTAHVNKKTFPSALNRHSALHGLDFEYGTKINSLKALSLLIYIADFST